MGFTIRIRDWVGEVDRLARSARAAQRRAGIARETLAERRRFRRTPPVTLNEKIRYRMAFDRRPILRTFSDKLAVREYVADRVGPEILNQIYAVVEHPDELDLDALPQPCVTKPSHGSGAVIISHPDADPDAAIPPPGPRDYWPYVLAQVRPERLQEKAFRTLATRWLQADYANAYGGWCYRGIPRRLIVERYLGTGLQPPTDYRFWMVNGNVAFIDVDINQWGARRRSIHRADWTPVAARMRYPRPEFPPPRPDCLSGLTKIAETLSAGINFVRVDLYIMEESVIFGEITNHPVSGQGEMEPSEVFGHLVGKLRLG